MKERNNKQKKVPFMNNKGKEKLIKKKNNQNVPANETNSSAGVGVASSSHTATLDAVKNQKSQILKKKHNGEGSIPGFIFMCNGITKPECYKYRVFGLPAGKLDIIRKIKPGATLFLFDVDLKLLYGLYKAATSGEMNLEPHAFNGKFPAQVRFEIYRDCLPLPESSFKGTIRANYNGVKFSPELTNRQLKALRYLLRPYKPPSNEAPIPLFVPTAVVEHHPPPTRVPHLLVRNPYLPPPARYLPPPELVPRTYDHYREPVRASHLQAVLDPQQPVANHTLRHPLYAVYYSTEAHVPYYQRETRAPYQPETNPSYYQPERTQPYDPERPTYPQDPYASYRSASMTSAYGPSYYSSSHQPQAVESSTSLLGTSAEYYSQPQSTSHSTTAVQPQSLTAASYVAPQPPQPMAHSTSVQIQNIGAAAYVHSQQPHTGGELPATRKVSYYGAPVTYELRAEPSLSTVVVPVSCRYGFSGATIRL